MGEVFLSIVFDFKEEHYLNKNNKNNHLIASAANGGDCLHAGNNFCIIKYDCLSSRSHNNS
jgi:hypothetical protein